MADAEVLGRATLFRGIPLNGLSHLAEQGREQTFPAGAILMQQGESSHNMYVIVSGKVSVERSHPALIDPIILAELGPGDVVGEMGLLDDEPRTATVIANEDTETVELGAGALSEAMVRYPEVAKSLLRMLSRRLRSTDELIEQMLRTGQTAPRTGEVNEADDPRDQLQGRQP
jgi:CRP-like cAMP-binding protein